jgi:glycerophosphoryl diester phosphodiesterase
MRLSRSAIDPVMRRAGWLRGLTVAHRGLHDGGARGGRMENSPAAFAAAIAAGLAIECDVQLTRDGEAVVFHDFTLDRLTAQTGPVIERSAADLTRLALGDSGDTLLRLADLLAMIGGRVPLLVEVKMRADGDFAALCGAVARDLAPYAGPVAVMSFDPRVPEWFAAHAPLVPRGLILDSVDLCGGATAARRHRALRQAQADFLAVDVRGLPNRFVARQRRQGLPIATWTVRRPAQRATALAHADALIAEGAGLP